MKKNLFIIILLLLFVKIYSYSQDDLIKIELTLVDSMENPRFKITPVFELNNKNRVYKNKKKYKIKTPNENTSYGIAYIYFNGFSKVNIPQSIPVLIENYKNENPLFYFDNNNNLDFSDDGEPKTYNKKLLEVSKHKYRYLNHHFIVDNTKSKFSFIILKLNKFDNLGKLKSQIRTSKKEKVVPENYWIGCYPFNKVRGELVGTKNQIELIDINCNLKYNEKDIDRIILINQNNAEKEVQDKWKVGENIVTQVGKTFYEIINIDSKGKNITLKEVDSLNQSLKLHKGDNVNYLPVKSLLRKNKTIGQSTTNNKKVLLYFWGSWCAPCKAILPELKEIYSQHNNELEIIAIAKDTPSKVKTYIKKNEITWQNVLATQSTLSSLNITSYPTFILLDSNGIIIKEKVDVNEIKNLIK